MATDLQQALIDDPDVEAVEIKLTVRDDQESLVHAALERVDAESQRRTVYFIDDPELTLYDAGLVLRARKIDGDTDNTTVKLRPVEPGGIDARWKKLAEFAIEVDAVGTNLVCSAKLDADQSGGEIDEWLAGEREAAKLFSSDQEKLLEAHAPAGVDLTTVGPIGPIAVRKWEVQPKKLEDEVTVEEWALPDGSTLLELSIKVEPQDAVAAGERFRAFLTALGVDVEGDQQTKTKAALSYFTGRAL